MSDITIIMPSYNKEKYIAQALDSIFMQDTTYNYHVIVADDCSTDRTVEIVKQYQEKHPSKITLLESECNQKLYRNVRRAYEMTKTDYFCVLDPDDYWTDKGKIQKSLDFLESHKDYTIYITATDKITKDGKIEPFINTHKVVDSTFDDFLNNKAKLGHTLGCVFRNVIFKNGLPEKMVNLDCETCEQSFRGDTFRALVHLEKGKAHFVPEVDALYRITDEGIWQGSDDISRDIFNATIFKDLWLYFDKKYPELLFISYKNYNLVKNDFITTFKNIKNEQKIQQQAIQLSILKELYDENENSIEKCIMKLPYKQKIRYLIYKRMFKKLHRKGIV
ncbi:glycosyltransferase [bacterium]|nr:glycosyltransferase [bacterium]